MSTTPQILLVGHCVPDSFSLSRLVKDASPQAKTERVNSDKALQAHLNGAALLLVNRVLDGRFEAGDGIELIRRLRADGCSVPIMLISNYSEAQDVAVEAGALRGFGKRELRASSTADRVRAAIGANSGASA